MSEIELLNFLEEEPLGPESQEDREKRLKAERLQKAIEEIRIAREKMDDELRNPPPGLGIYDFIEGIVRSIASTQRWIHRECLNISHSVNQ